MGVLEFVNKSITGITSPMPKISSIVVIIKKKTKINLKTKKQKLFMEDQ